jgi:multiple sugar transport system ATP-binding protein
MKAGRVQQYAAPLEIYNQPINLFSAEFIGNPTMNFLDVECCKDAAEDIQLVSQDLSFTLTPIIGKPSPSKGQKLVLGLRPEHVSLTGNGSINGRVYSTLPSGMETIVMIRIKDTLLTSVAFGGQDFDVDSEIGLTFDHDNYFLFDKDSGEKIAAGTLRIAAKDGS